MMSGNAEIVAAKLYVPATSFDVKKPIDGSVSLPALFCW
jgi:hypothetical protein